MTFLFYSEFSDPTPMETRNCSHTPDEEEEDVQYHPHSQPDFNVEEFVVFPHVPEFILGQEVQNGRIILKFRQNSNKIPPFLHQFLLSRFRPNVRRQLRRLQHLRARPS